jgi:hypothetical protein
MFDLAFVLLDQPRHVSDAAVVAAAAELGLTLSPRSEASPRAFTLPEGELYLMSIDAPHPDAQHAAHGPLAAPIEVVQSARAHLIVTARNLPGDLKARRRTLLLLTAAVTRAFDAVAVIFGEGVIFHRPGLVIDFAALAAETGELPLEMAVDITVARESDTRMSFLTHGLAQHGSEDLLVTCPIEGRGALDFVLGVARWFFRDPELRLPTGDTLGRDASERVPIQRVPSPVDPERIVVRLDLPS